MCSMLSRAHLLDLIKEHDAAGTTPDSLGELAPVLVALEACICEQGVGCV